MESKGEIYLGFIDGQFFIGEYYCNVIVEDNSTSMVEYLKNCAVLVFQQDPIAGIIINPVNPIPLEINSFDSKIDIEMSKFVYTKKIQKEDRDGEMLLKSYENFIEPPKKEDNEHANDNKC